MRGLLQAASGARNAGRKDEADAATTGGRDAAGSVVRSKPRIVSPKYSPESSGIVAGRDGKKEKSE